MSMNIDYGSDLNKANPRLRRRSAFIFASHNV
jgi:hypothetical protein